MVRATSQVTPWQCKVLQNGRTPLPDSPGHRPWLDPDFSLSTSVPSRSNTGHYKFWTEEELELLVLLRRKGVSWVDLQFEFPGRALDGIKRAHHNQREAVERRMAERKLAAKQARVKKARTKKTVAIAPENQERETSDETL
ncbi:hypothetical protein FSARC_4820 [Fusarium sarcochroum]|uniref:Myb-like domain-containing protein n=1 Tax=Fusarium sarcochroum TaxID=1208366 RepID=A0A8H4U0V5_9HYPO|nr:hypothetical protein FSARC_4820 [Fusarium sarcochroum]